MTRPFILSLHPHWAQRIYDGTKTLEIRRRFATPDKAPRQALIYTTAPVKAITGLVTVNAITPYSTKDLSPLHHAHCVTNKQLESYLDKKGVGLWLENPRRLDKPVKLDTLRQDHDFTPPQSFAYADQSLETAISTLPLSVFHVAPYDAKDIPFIHPLINLLRIQYPDIDSWFHKVREENRRCWVLKDTTDLRGLAIMKDTPNGTKLCSFFTDARGQGTPFLTSVITREIARGSTQFYAEASTTATSILGFFKKNGWRMRKSHKRNITLMTWSAPSAL